MNKELEETKSICRAIRKNMKCESTFDLNTLKLNKNNEEAIGNLLQYIDQLENKVKELEKNKTNIKILSNAGIYQLGFNDGQKQYKRLVNNIKNKIEKLDKEEKEIYKKDIGNNELYRLKIIDETRKVLQELLEATK